MIPVRLTISGFLSYREPAEIDFTGIHVACISGRNGAGKSAMLDAMTWALFGEARRNDDSVVNDTAEDQTAKVEFEFLYEDAPYLIRRQKSKGKSSVVEFFIRSAEGKSWKPLTEKKVADTNKRICNTLRMDYKTFINASFFLQGKADQFTGQTASERKRILSNILDLEIWEVYKAKATEKRKLAENNAQYIRGLIDDAENELKQEKILLEEYEAAKARADELGKAYKDADEKWQLAKAGEASLKVLRDNAELKKQEEDRQMRVIREQKTVLEERVRELETLREKLADADAIEKNYAALKQVRDQLDKVTVAASEYSRLENDRIRLDSVIQSTEKQLRYEYAQLSRDNAELDRLLPEKQRLSTLRETQSVRVRELEPLCAALPDIRQKREEIKIEGQECRHIIDDLEMKINEISLKIEKFLANRGGVCPTCGREMDEEHCRNHAAELNGEISKIRADQDAKKAEREIIAENYKRIDRQVKSLEEQEKELNSLHIELNGTEQNLHMIEDRLSHGEEKKARMAAVEKTLKDMDFCTEERVRLAEVRGLIEALAYDRVEHERLNREKVRLSGAEREHQALIANRSRIEPLEREIGEKKDALADAETRLKSLHTERDEAEKNYLETKDRMPDLQQIESDRIRINRERDRAGKELGQAEQRVRHLDEARKVLGSRSAEYQDKLQEIRRYKDLEKAFGKDGIPVILIDQVLPEIQDQANTLLDKLSNGSMSLQLKTQGTYKSRKDDVKETLDILIEDPYGVREYELFSGGEAFRINFSIRLALSRILAQRAGSRLQTLVIDEGFGSQDEEGRARLAEAIIAVQDDFEKILVITHLSELKEVFPSRIEVSKTDDGSHIEVIP